VVLGLIAVATPGTPVSMMNNVDPARTNAPETGTSSLTAEYTVRAQQIVIQRNEIQCWDWDLSTILEHLCLREGCRWGIWK